MRALGGVLLLILALAFGVTPQAPAAVVQADGPVTCPPGARPDPYSGRCIIAILPPVEAPGPAPGPGNGDGGGGSGGGDEPQVCQWIGPTKTVDVECASGYGYYSSAKQCYVQALDPQPPHSDDRWQGNSEGAIYRCTPPYWYDIGMIAAFDFWAPSAPSGPAPPPDPRLLAQQAIATMDLTAITIGMVPESGPDRLGLVGMPAWMWVEEPSANTWGPITRSASSRGYTVSATAQVEQVRWDMGDGTTLTCGAGTRYEDRYGKTDSPTCGHTYTRQGEYTVTATSHWVITWAGIGQNGTITMDLTRPVPVAVGEVQVLRQH